MHFSKFGGQCIVVSSASQSANTIEHVLLRQHCHTGRKHGLKAPLFAKVDMSTIT